MAPQVPSYLRITETLSHCSILNAMTFQIKRVYEAATPADGTRVLVDRLWPRGLRKADAKWMYWMKDVAPSPELRRWFGHEPERFAEFSRRYKKELRENAALG